MIEWFSQLNFAALLNAMPRNVVQGLVWGIMALGVYLTYKILNFADLTVDGSLATGGAVAAMLIIKGWNPWLVLIISFLAGMLAGLTTGILHTVLGIPDILAGILTQIALYSINLDIMGQSNRAVNSMNKQLVILSREVSRSMIISLVFVGIIITLIYWYLGTEHGSTIRATGCNPNMAKAQGININVNKVIGLVLSNGLVALAGGLLAQYSGNADINMGRGAIVIGLAAVIIGQVLCEAILRKHINFAWRLIFTVIGAIIYYIVLAIVVWFKFKAENFKLLTAVIVAIFLAVPYLKAKYAKPKSKEVKADA